jgi:SIR2-like domain
VRTAVERSRRYESALQRFDYPACFSVLESEWSRVGLEDAVRKALAPVTTPTALVDRLIDWPFAGYITTNYDDLLFRTVSKVDAGWSRVGNSGEEIRQVSGEASRVIWHIHGSIELPSNQSRLVITAEDYEALYPESAVIEQLRGLLSQRRVIFIGFGFRDARLATILTRVGSLTDPGRPMFAFLPVLGIPRNVNLRQDLLEQSNVDTIPYAAPGQSHQRLDRLIELYSAFVLGRSLRFNQPQRSVPSYHPETAGLLIYNELRLRRSMEDPAILELLLRSRVLARLKNEGPMTVGDVVAELGRRSSDLGLNRSVQDAETEVQRVITDLLEEGVIELMDPHGERIIELTSRGGGLLEEQSALASRLARQFHESLISRVAAMGLSDDGRKRVSAAAEAFVRDCIRRRALGVGMTAIASTADHQKFQLTALLQSLPGFMGQLPDADEALALTQVVQEVLARPTQAEEEYVGLTLQAVFAVHLLGYDSKTLAVRAEMFRDTVFLADSSLLIELLAEGCPGHLFAKQVLEQLKGLGSTVATTRALTHEVAEHAQWASKHVDPASGAPDVTTFMAASGRAGGGSNEFLTGFLEQVYIGAVPARFPRYMEAVFGRHVSNAPTPTDVEFALRSHGITCERFDQWEGYTVPLSTRRAEVASAIARRRQEMGTFTHERQAAAEAEVVLLVEGIRNRTMRLNGRQYTGSFFLSNTRAIDEVTANAIPITMRAESAVEWAATIAPCPVAELRVLTSSLLTDLSRLDVDVLDTRRLSNVFEPLISASKDRLEDVKTRHRSLLVSRYGSSVEESFSNVAPLDAPVVVESVNALRLKVLEAKVNAQQTHIGRLAKDSALTTKEREELAQLRVAARQRQRKADSRRRASRAREPRTR